jgi:transcriptional regulator with XRE-family HTH domain
LTFAERFGRNLVRHRERMGITQEELGMRAELHRTAVGQLERAERVPRADTVVKLAGSLGIRPELLLEGLGWEPSVRTMGALVIADERGRERVRTTWPEVVRMGSRIAAAI